MIQTAIHWTNAGDNAVEARVPWGRLGYAKRERRHSSVQYSKLEWTNDWYFYPEMPIGTRLIQKMEQPCSFTDLMKRTESRWNALWEGAE